MSHRTCSISGCERRHEARGWCTTHYAKWKRTGDPLHVDPVYALRYEPVEARFRAKVEELPSGCWRWTANCQKRKGAPAYGLFKTGGVNMFAHRWAYEQWIGPIPNDRQIDHYRFPQDGCIGPVCVNPEHLRPATIRENNLRSDAPSAWNAAKTHCAQGHPFSGDNLRIKRSGQRCCRICTRRQWSAGARRRKARRASQEASPC